MREKIEGCHVDVPLPYIPPSSCRVNHLTNSLPPPSQPRVGEVPLLIFAYLGFSLFVSGFIMTVLAYAPTDSYLMVMIQSMGVMGFLGPIVLVIGSKL